MQQKLRDFMTSEGLKSGQLAELLGINPAGISHLLAGRNKPSFELLQKMLSRFPRLNPDWLLLDRGPMYRDTESATPAVPIPEPSTQAAPMAQLFDTSSSSEPTSTPVTEAQQIVATTANKKCSVARIVIFYDDQTFESFTPNR
ncbi:MAG: helix-turn-helix transcriptional regulator [Rikenellaceae bacterium]|nr:helix-turn-helix transcriptional regulator [Rikenellaceae bacterium]